MSSSACELVQTGCIYPCSWPRCCCCYYCCCSSCCCCCGGCYCGCCCGRGCCCSRRYIQSKSTVSCFNCVFIFFKKVISLSLSLSLSLCVSIWFSGSLSPSLSVSLSPSLSLSLSLSSLCLCLSIFFFWMASCHHHFPKGMPLARLPVLILYSYLCSRAIYVSLKWFRTWMMLVIVLHTYNWRTKSRRCERNTYKKHDFPFSELLFLRIMIWLLVKKKHNEAILPSYILMPLCLEGCLHHIFLLVYLGISVSRGMSLCFLSYSSVFLFSNLPTAILLLLSRTRIAIQWCCGKVYLQALCRCCHLWAASEGAEPCGTV